MFKRVLFLPLLFPTLSYAAAGGGAGVTPDDVWHAVREERAEGLAGRSTPYASQFPPELESQRDDSECVSDTPEKDKKARARRRDHISGFQKYLETVSPESWLSQEISRQRAAGRLRVLPRRLLESVFDSLFLMTSDAPLSADGRTYSDSDCGNALLSYALDTFPDIVPADRKLVLKQLVAHIRSLPEESEVSGSERKIVLSYALMVLAEKFGRKKMWPVIMHAVQSFGVEKKYPKKIAALRGDEPVEAIGSQLSSLGQSQGSVWQPDFTGADDSTDEDEPIEDSQ